MNVVKTLEQNLMQSLVAGAIGTGITLLMYPDAMGASIPVMNFELPVPIVTGLSVAAGNLGGEILSEYVLPHIPQNEMYAGYEKKIVPPVMSGLATYGIARILTGQADLQASMIIGGGASAVGGYVYGM